MNMEFAHRHLIPAGLNLLPERMDTPAARAMLLAIGAQESGWRYRRQMGNGPARGWWQFELAGISGVITHYASREPAAETIRALGYPATAAAVHGAIEHNDLLAVVFARLLLWRHPDPLADASEPDEAYSQYLACWRPGRPRSTSWRYYFNQAWDLVKGVVL